MSAIEQAGDLNKEQNVPISELSNKKKAKSLPGYYFDLISGNSNRAHPGLIFTEDNLRSIRLYADIVRVLPHSIEDVEGLADFNVLQIDAQLIFDLYEALHRHIAEWDNLERETKTLGAQLEICADAMQSKGGVLLSDLEASDVYQEVKRKRAALENPSDYVPGELESGEKKEIYSGIEKSLKSLLQDIEDAANRIRAVEERAEWFAREIQRELQPRLRKVLKNTKEKLSDERMGELNSQLDEMDKKIEELKSEYDSQVGYAFTGMLLGPLGIIVTGGIFGSTAEGIRAEKNALIDRRRIKALEVESFGPAVKKFEDINTSVLDIEFRLKDVLSAAKNLSDVWLNLKAYVESSSSEAASFSLDVDVDTFVQELSDVIRPWGRIGDISRNLSKLFNEAI